MHLKCGQPEWLGYSKEATNQIWEGVRAIRQQLYQLRNKERQKANNKWKINKTKHGKPNIRNAAKSNRQRLSLHY